METTSKTQYDNCEIELSTGAIVEGRLYIRLIPDWCYEVDSDTCDAEQITKQLESGDLGAFIVEVTCEAMGIECEDMLGGVLLGVDSNLEDVVREYAKDYDLERNAIDEVKDKLNEVIKVATQISGGKACY